jgi:DNA (cytosine-5)-methyltransferase 1
MKIKKPRDHLTISNAARLVGVHPATLRNWEKLGKISCYRHPMSKYRLYKKEDLEAILGSITKEEEDV